METIKNIINWTLIAFLFGAFLVIGTRTVNIIWPEKQPDIVVKHIWVERE